MQCGLLGEKLSHSYSPEIHKYLGNYSYDLLEKKPEELDSFFANCTLTGFNVTIPYKKAVIPYCHHLTQQAKQLGAVNTIVRQPDGTLVGHNTDYYGFYQMAKRVDVDYAEKKVLVLGSGGASNTVCAVLKELGANVIVISRSGENHYENLHLHSDCAVIVNTTPVGMYPHTEESAVDLTVFPKLEAVLDLIYNPKRTKLLMDAEKLGLKTENGLWMLVAQAKESAQWFTGQTIEDSVIASICTALSKKTENIILIGMPGCGKTTNGKKLAELLNKDFVDADKKIEEAAQCSIPEIFSNYGEDAFRKIETQVLSDIGKQSGLVVATGGGCVTRPENYPLLHQNGRIFWLCRDTKQLPTNGRPLSQTTDLNQMYQKREPLYRAFADHRIECGATPEQTTNRILAVLDKEIQL